MGPVTTAVLDDTCGNLIQIAAEADRLGPDACGRRRAPAPACAVVRRLYVVVPSPPEQATQKVLCFTSAPRDPSAWTVSETW